MKKKNITKSEKKRIDNDEMNNFHDEDEKSEVIKNKQKKIIIKKIFQHFKNMFIK